MRNEIVTSLAEQRNMGSKAIFEPAANVPERATPEVGCVVNLELRSGKRVLIVELLPPKIAPNPPMT